MYFKWFHTRKNIVPHYWHEKKYSDEKFNLKKLNGRSAKRCFDFCLSLLSDFWRVLTNEEKGLLWLIWVFKTGFVDSYPYSIHQYFVIFCTFKKNNFALFMMHLSKIDVWYLVCRSLPSTSFFHWHPLMLVFPQCFVRLEGLRTLAIHILLQKVEHCLQV